MGEGAGNECTGPINLQQLFVMVQDSCSGSVPTGKRVHWNENQCTFLLSSKFAKTTHIYERRR